jgi:hypothetical protein
MGCSILLEEEEHGQQGIPASSANRSSAVIDQAISIDEIHYSIGNRVYIENI